MNKKSLVKIIISFYLILVAIAIMTIVIDPLFHYHKPLSFLQYRINNERYHNDGITRNFKYDAIITGSSMTENFKSSELDKLFNVNSIKIPYSGGSLHETSIALENAFKHNGSIKKIIRSLDDDMLIANPYNLSYSGYPTYLYDDNIVNDVNYVLNKDILCENTLETINHTIKGRKTKSFDEYCNWMSSHEFGKDVVLNKYERSKKSNDYVAYSSLDYEMEISNLQENIIKLANNYKDTEFYYFLTPYSIVYFDDINQKGKLNRFFEIEKVAIESLIDIDNVHLYGFLDCYDVITNLDNYTDICHYSEDINSFILDSMSKNEHLLTKDNYLEYCNKVREYYLNYDYSGIFK